METQTQNQNQTQNLPVTELTNNFKGIVPTHALITNVKMKNGKQASITTLFNNADFSFEEINKGVRQSLISQFWLPIDKSQATLYNLRNGKPEKAIQFFEESYNR